MNGYEGGSDRILPDRVVFICCYWLVSFTRYATLIKKGFVGERAWSSRSWAVKGPT